jgi:hypothetical protein
VDVVEEEILNVAVARFGPEARVQQLGIANGEPAQTPLQFLAQLVLLARLALDGN